MAWTRQIKYKWGATGYPQVSKVGGIEISKISKYNTIEFKYNAGLQYYSNNPYLSGLTTTERIGGGAGHYDAFYIDKTGQAWGCGGNGGGNLGINSTTNQNSPVAVCGNHTFIHITGSGGGSGIDKDGQAWCWGRNYYGKLGINSTVTHLTPVAVCGNHTFKHIHSGAYQSYGVDINGQGWAWGNNDYGKLGNNSFTDYSTPVAVCGNHTFTKIFYVHKGSTQGSALALDKNGQAWCWGYNGVGTLGDNTTINRYTPVAVCGNHTFVDIAGNFGYACGCIRTDGSIWVWGGNDYGQLGDNTSTNRSTPVQVCGNHTFKQLHGGAYGFSGLDENGQVWCWGRNLFGELGDGTTISRRTPVAVCGNHTFCYANGADYASNGVDVNNKFWAWGRGSIGTVGDGNFTDRCTPVAVCGIN